jgi:hypothetical protein
MTAEVIPIKGRGGSMPCPSEAALTIRASLTEPADPTEELEPELSVGDLDAHVARCPGCAEQLEALRRSLRSWSTADVEQVERFDAAYFEELAGAIEAELDAPRPVEQSSAVVPLRRHRPGPVLALVGAIAALLALALLFGPDRTAAPEVEVADDATDALEQEGRALGRSLLAEALAEEDDVGVVAISLSQDELLGELDAEHWSYRTTIEDELDELTTEELQSLGARL